jgi:hypothetical protein
MLAALKPDVLAGMVAANPALAAALKAAMPPTAVPEPPAPPAAVADGEARVVQSPPCGYN